MCIEMIFCAFDACLCTSAHSTPALIAWCPSGWNVSPDVIISWWQLCRVWPQQGDSWPCGLWVMKTGNIRERECVPKQRGRGDLVKDRGRGRLCHQHYWQQPASLHFSASRIVASESGTLDYLLLSSLLWAPGNGCVITAIFRPSDRVTSFHTSQPQPLRSKLLSLSKWWHRLQWV